MAKCMIYSSQDLDMKLIALINNFRNTIALNNLLIKEKIIRKLVILANMCQLGFPIMNYSNEQGNQIIDTLQAIDKQGDIVKYVEQTNDSNKLLGDILHNAYQASGYNLLVSNVPISGVTVNGEHITVDAESVYDTLDQITPSGIASVIQVASDTYLAKFIDPSNAKYVSSVIHKKMIASNIITAEYIINKPLQSTSSDSLDDIDDVMSSPVVEKELPLPNKYGFLSQWVGYMNLHYISIRQWLYNLVLKMVPFSLSK